VLTYIFGILLRIFKVGGFVNFREDPAGFFSFLILPAVSVSIPKIAMMTKYVRNAMVAERKKDYITTARSKGLSEFRVMLNHALINAVTPFITMLAMTVADILAGSIVVEKVFNIPGIGGLLINSISNRDNPVVLCIVVLTAAIVVVLNTLADILHKAIDPRIDAVTEENY
ncbi:MAG: ABC transporter permease, partial [Lachnospiraceae bacterium]|nr:ABC transporter permease [Lachnospiraceae bacterium]